MLPTDRRSGKEKQNERELGKVKKEKKRNHAGRVGDDESVILLIFVPATHGTSYNKSLKLGWFKWQVLESKLKYGRLQSLCTIVCFVKERGIEKTV